MRHINISSCSNFNDGESAMNFYDKKVKMGSNVIAINAKESIKDGYGILRELILNSSDNLFGIKFFEFTMNESQEKNDIPFIPTLDTYFKWKQKLAKQKFGEIKIKLNKFEIEVIDNGSGIKEDLIADNIGEYSKQHTKNLKNSPELHRRGQFSRGLKEVAAFILTQNKYETKSHIKIETAFKAPNGIIKEWQGEYYLKNTELKFKTVNKPKESQSKKTFTKVTLSFPKCQPVTGKGAKIADKLEKKLWMKQVLNEHNVILYVKREKKIALNSWLQDNIKKIDEFRKKIVIPDSNENLIRNLNSTSFEIFMHIYEINSHSPLDSLRTTKTLENQTLDYRGIILEDYTTSYGFYLSNGVEGTEFLQAEVIIPALRVASILGATEESSNPYFASSGRQNVNFDHPIVKLSKSFIMKHWENEIQKQRKIIQRAEKRARNEKQIRVDRKLENHINQIFREELDKTPGRKGGLQGSSSRRKIERKNPAFGPILTKSLNLGSIHPGEEKEVKCYVHKNLSDSGSFQVTVECDEDIIISHNGMQTSFEQYLLDHRAPISKDGLRYIKLKLKPSIQSNPPKKYELKFSINISADNPIHNLLKTNKIKENKIEYEDVFFYSKTLIHNNSLVLTAEISLKLRTETSQSGYVRVKWITDKVHQITVTRSEKQSDSQRGWIPVTNSKDDNKISITYKILCRSKYFSNTYNPSFELHEQRDDFETLRATALCSAMAQSIALNTEEDPGSQFIKYNELLNSKMSGILNILKDKKYLEEQ